MTPYQHDTSGRDRLSLSLSLLPLLLSCPSSCLLNVGTVLPQLVCLRFRSNIAGILDGIKMRLLLYSPFVTSASSNSHGVSFRHLTQSMRLLHVTFEPAACFRDQCLAHFAVAPDVCGDALGVHVCVRVCACMCVCVCVSCVSARVCA
jgi:hypothetical protein